MDTPEGRIVVQQVMQAHAKRIAEKYRTDQAAWKKAGDEICQPYWDWADKSVPPDEVIAMKRVTITAPDGEEIVDNPLYHYDFPQNTITSFPISYRNWGTTLRHPRTADPDAMDDVESLREYVPYYCFGETQIENISSLEPFPLFRRKLPCKLTSF